MSFLYIIVMKKQTPLRIHNTHKMNSLEICFLSSNALYFYKLVIGPASVINKIFKLQTHNPFFSQKPFSENCASCLNISVY